MMEGKFQVVAGTPQKLFEKLADEAVQDIEFVDTYLLNHRSFMTSIELLDQLIDRFYLTPIPGEYEYFKKWQSSIQTKVLTVIYRWITISFQDFKNDKKLQKRLDLFRFSDSVKLFQYQSDKINFALEAKDNQLKDAKASSLLDTSHPSSMPQSRRLSETFFSFQSFDALSLTLNSPSLMDISYQNRHNLESSYTTFMSLDTKDIARYLTLADYYLLKSVHEQGIHDQKISTKVDYVQIMTERANMLGHWVAHELCHLNYLKSKRSLVKKWIDIAKTCYDLNNFHTCMVITMGLESTPKLKEVWESLSNKDSSAFALLQKLLDVNMNMRYYRQKTKQVKSPAVPFLPVVLKDYTFLNENPTFLRAYPNLINFSKFIFIKQFTDKTFGLLQESYWFSNELSHFPFLQQDHYQNTEGSLDHVARWIENRLNQIKHCYLHCDLLCRQ
ncbi:ras guanine nucleotide exchange factor domain-containing protein [Blakeslea trispora]|nr:ras guanine nucleotide exchange factor domain-containing protein [Blakeslea trispora]